MKLISLFLVLFSFSTFSSSLCQKQKFNDFEIEVISELAVKLDYSMDELCSNPRIFDIQKEKRVVFNRKTQKSEAHLVITLHYNEYSCEYHFASEKLAWANDYNYCYSTW